MATDPITCSKSKCNWPKCDCNVDFTEECPQGLQIQGHEDHEVIVGWTEEAFQDVFYNDNRVK